MGREEDELALPQTSTSWHRKKEHSICAVLVRRPSSCSPRHQGQKLTAQGCPLLSLGAAEMLDLEGGMRASDGSGGVHSVDCTAPR